MPHIYQYGSGTVGDPYQVWTPADLQGLNDYRSAYFKQMQDINMIAFSWEPIALDWDYFSGYYNGQLFEIQNLIINPQVQTSWPCDTLGLLGTASGATLEDIILVDTVINSDPVEFPWDIGPLAGYAEYCTFINCHVVNCNVTKVSWDAGGIAGEAIDCTAFGCSMSGIITGDYAVGGIFGYSERSYLEKCFSSGLISYYDVYQNAWGIGGLLGEVYEGTDIELLKNCYSTSVIFGGLNGGGLIGNVSKKWNTTGANITITNSYFSGACVAYEEGSVGPLVGDLDDQHTLVVNNCYYNSENPGGDIATHGTPKTLTELRVQATFDNWDFSGVWNILSGVNDGLPHLRDIPVDQNYYFDPDNFEEPYPGPFVFSDNVIPFNNFTVQRDRRWYDYGIGDIKHHDGKFHLVSNAYVVPDPNALWDYHNLFVDTLSKDGLIFNKITEMLGGAYGDGWDWDGHQSIEIYNGRYYLAFISYFGGPNWEYHLHTANCNLDGSDLVHTKRVAGDVYGVKSVLDEASGIIYYLYSQRVSTTNRVMLARYTIAQDIFETSYASSMSVHSVNYLSNIILAHGYLYYSYCTQWNNNYHIYMGRAKLDFTSKSHYMITSGLTEGFFYPWVVASDNRVYCFIKAGYQTRIPTIYECSIMLNNSFELCRLTTSSVTHWQEPILYNDNKLYVLYRATVDISGTSYWVPFIAEIDLINRTVKQVQKVDESNFPTDGYGYLWYLRAAMSDDGIIGVMVAGMYDEGYEVQDLCTATTFSAVEPPTWLANQLRVSFRHKGGSVRVRVKKEVQL
jgi:hypothetical protein